MNNDMAVWAVVPAAGSGLRMAADKPKQYLDLGGKPILERSLDCLLAQKRVAGAVVVLGQEDDDWNDLGYRHAKPVLTASGGDRRQHSVYSGLVRLQRHCGDETIALVHDAVRPLLNRADLDAVIAAASGHAVGAILAAPVVDTLKREGKDMQIEATLPRDRLWRALTPQAFRLPLLLRALEQANENGVNVTDEAQAVELAGLSPLMVQGNNNNIKITSAEDLALARLLWSNQHYE